MKAYLDTLAIRDELEKLCWAFHGKDQECTCLHRRALEVIRTLDQDNLRMREFIRDRESVAWVTMLWSEDGESFFPKARIFATREEAEAHKREMDADGGRHGITIETVTRKEDDDG